MQYPTCNHLNGATSVRCSQCGTTLIHEAVGHSDAYLKTVNKMDTRVYSGVGAFFGFFLVAALLKTVLSGLWWTDRQIYGFAVVGSVVGGLLGRLFLRFKKEG